MTAWDELAHSAALQWSYSCLEKFQSLRPDTSFFQSKPPASMALAESSRSSSALSSPVSSASTQSAPSECTDPPTNTVPSYIESPMPSPASPHTIIVPRCIMNPDM